MTRVDELIQIIQRAADDLLEAEDNIPRRLDPEGYYLSFPRSGYRGEDGFGNPQPDNKYLVHIAYANACVDEPDEVCGVHGKVDLREEVRFMLEWLPEDDPSYAQELIEVFEGLIDMIKTAIKNGDYGNA